MDLGFSISDEFLTAIVTVVMSLALIAALVCSKRRTGLVLTPVTAFLLFAFVHSLFSRYAATLLAPRYSFFGPATIEPFINQSFLIISTGVTCCLLGYVFVPRTSGGRAGRFLAGISCQEALDQICARSRILIVVAIPLIVIGLLNLGGIPLLSDNPRQDRYLLNFTPEHRLDTFLVNRGREMIVFPGAAMALGWFFRKRRVMDAIFVLLAAAACVLTATRAPLLIGVSIVLLVLVWKSRFSVVFLTTIAVFSGLLVSEIALGGDSSPGTGEWTTLDRVGSDLSEVRDLAWNLVKHDGNYWGLTFLAGLLPVPAFASDFTQTYHLRTITLNAINIPLTAAHGGLRVTYTGEWYLNFGWTGVVFGGLLYGWMCSWFSSLFHRLRDAATYPVGVFALTCAWVTTSFMIYMAGTGSGGTLKTYFAVLALLLVRLPRTAPTSSGSRLRVAPSAVLVSPPVPTLAR